MVVKKMMLCAAICMSCIMMSSGIFAQETEAGSVTLETEAGSVTLETEAETADDAVRKVIIDTDTGADDASALILAAKSPNLEILGVTVLAGNVSLDQGAENALMALEIAGSDVPVYRGSDKSFDGKEISVFSVFGTDGMGENDLIHPTGKAEDQDAIDFILETVNKYPDEVELIALGPATNFARAIEQDPETMQKVKKIWSMGTSGLGPGNASPVAEFNVYNDPEAYKIMLDSGVDIAVVGLDMCGGAAMWTDSQFDELNTEGSIGEFITASFEKIRQFYAANGLVGTVMDCDACAMMCVVNSDFVNSTISCHGSCITEPGETYGQVIFYQEGLAYDMITNNDYDYNVSLVSDVDKEEYFDLYMAAIQ